MLALRSLRDVLQNVALDLHAAPVIAMVGDLDESVEVVVRGRRVARSSCAARRAIYVLLPGHTAVGRNCQAECVATLGLLVFVGSSDISADRRLPNFLLQQLLILFVLLGVLLEELA